MDNPIYYILMTFIAISGFIIAFWVARKDLSKNNYVWIVIISIVGTLILAAIHEDSDHQGQSGKEEVTNEVLIADTTRLNYELKPMHDVGVFDSGGWIFEGSWSPFSYDAYERLNSDNACLPELLQYNLEKSRLVKTGCYIKDSSVEVTSIMIERLCIDFCQSGNHLNVTTKDGDYFIQVFTTNRSDTTQAAFFRYDKLNYYPWMLTLVQKMPSGMLVASWRHRTPGGAIIAYDYENSIGYARMELETWVDILNRNSSFYCRMYP